MQISEEVRTLEEENRDLKAELEMLREVHGTEGKPMKCQDCIHFMQHYIRDGYIYVKINNGHCTAGKLKNRKSEDKTCQFFVKKGQNQ